ncbi:hypothetical protein Ahy_B03g067121 isoform A [Arachis hypogaea]|uniref:SWIM-type domain-containing protein n=1 Tax=Arachis hypogaea TaxID=3818 RepID=A0A445A5V6_ARAHY|nr:hypothetical protein Ahy_B03g067121 isoform A [Arachis hypogaea]
MAFAGKVEKSGYVRLKTLKSKHTCGRNYSGRIASSNWIAKKITNNLSRGEDMKLGTVIQTIQEKYMANISVWKAYWARRKAREVVHGKAVQQYGRIRDYCAKVFRANPGSTLKLKLDRPCPTIQPRFVRMYMYLDAVKKGFLAACRPIIGFDGCHLKSDHGQQLLVAVGRDPNDNYFPLAVTAVEAETKDSWAWFLELLLQDIGDFTNKKWGLLQVFHEMLLGVEHRFCLRHLYANCKKAFVLRDLILSTVKATYVEEWNRKMDRLKEVNKECYDKLAALDPKVWTKSHFTPYAKSDMLMNNISETFNGQILEARDKPILTMFEWIICYWMGRFAEKKKKGAKFMGKILPKPRKRLDIICRRSMEWQPRWAGDLKYEVSHKNKMIQERFVVDLLAGSCSCRFWGLAGMPCQHACSAIFMKGDNPEDYCSNYYTPAAYLACYETTLNPINGENMWPKVELETIRPPIFRVKPGRPRRVRIREHDEDRSQTKLRRSGTSVTCSNCD